VAEIPLKDSYKLSELCQHTDTQPYIVRFWESEFPQLNPERQRVYSRSDIELVQRIKELLHDEDYSLAAAREQLAQELGGSKRGRRAGKSRTKKSEADLPTSGFRRFRTSMHPTGCRASATTTRSTRSKRCVSNFERPTSESVAPRARSRKPEPRTRALRMGPRARSNGSSGFSTP